MTVLGSKIVELALAHKGQTEVPAGSNRGPFVQKCQAATFLSGTGWPWCAAFVCEVAEEAGVPLAYNGAGAHDIADHHAATRQTAASAKPGDVVDFNIGTGHTGILVRKNDNGTITTVDGNWADAVTEHDSSTYLVRGYWRIPGVSETAPKPKPKKLPAFVIATSHRGHRKILFRAKGKATITSWLLNHTLAKIAPNGITISRGKAR